MNYACSLCGHELLKRISITPFLHTHSKDLLDMALKVPAESWTHNFLIIVVVSYQIFTILKYYESISFLVIFLNLKSPGIWCSFFWPNSTVQVPSTYSSDSLMILCLAIMAPNKSPQTHLFSTTEKNGSLWEHVQSCYPSTHCFPQPAPIPSKQIQAFPIDDPCSPDEMTSSAAFFISVFLFPPFPWTTSPLPASSLR